MKTAYEELLAAKEKISVAISEYDTIKKNVLEELIRRNELYPIELNLNKLKRIGF